MRYCGVGQFFLQYFGNFNLELWYCGILQTCGMRFLLQVLQRFRAFSSFRSFHFLLIISQHAYLLLTYLFCLFCLNQIFTNLNFCFRIICSKLNVKYSGFSMTSSFNTVLYYCGIWRFFCNIAVFGKFFCGIAVFRTPNVPLSERRNFSVNDTGILGKKKF